MNERDKKLLKHLSHHGSTSAMSMARVLDVSETTARVLLERFTERDQVNKRVTGAGKKKRAFYTLNTKHEVFVLIKPEFKIRQECNGW